MNEEMKIPQEVEVMKRDAMAMYEDLQGMTIATQEQFDAAGDVVKRIKSAYNTLDDKRKSMTRPLDEAKKQIMDFFKSPLEKLQSAEYAVKGKISSYIAEQNRIAAEQQRKLEEQQRKEAEKIQARIDAAAAKGNESKVEQLQAKQEQILTAPTIVQPAVQKVSGVSTKKVWKFRVTDPGAFPREYLMVNEKALQAMATATKGTASIKGVEFYSEDVISVSGR